MTDGVRDGYAAVPTTPRPDSRMEQLSQHLELPSKRTVAWEKPPEHPGSCKPELSHKMTGKSPKPNHLRLTPVKRRRARTPAQPVPEHSDLYTLLNSRSSSSPGPGEYSPESAGRKHDFRRPYNPDTDGPFLLKNHDESTRVKAMACNLKTPDSGLGPGLYDTMSARVNHHVPQVTIGGYAPRDAVSKPWGSSYSRSVMAIQTRDDTAPAIAAKLQQELPVGVSLVPDEQLAWDVRWMVQHSTTPHNKAHHQASGAVAAKINPATHVTPAHSRQPAWRQGIFQPPWTSMRRRPSIASALPSDWGWAALGPCNDNGMFVRGAWAGDGRLEINHRSMLTSELASPVRSLTSSSLSSCKHSCESSYTEFEKAVAATALQPSFLQHDALQNVDIHSNASQHTAPAPLQQPVSAAENQCASADKYASKQLLDTTDWKHSCSQISCKTKQHSLPGSSTATTVVTSMQDQGVLRTSSMPDCASSWEVRIGHTFGQDTAVPANKTRSHDAATASVSGKHDGQKDSFVAVQSCTTTEAQMPLLTAADRHRHRQALKAAQQVCAIRKHQMLWSGNF